MFQRVGVGGCWKDQNKGQKSQWIIADGFDSANYILRQGKGRKGNMSARKKTNIPNAEFKRKKNKGRKTLNVFVVHCHESKTK